MFCFQETNGQVQIRRPGTGSVPQGSPEGGNRLLAPLRQVLKLFAPPSEPERVSVDPNAPVPAWQKRFDDVDGVLGELKPEARKVVADLLTEMWKVVSDCRDPRDATTDLSLVLSRYNLDSDIKAAAREIAGQLWAQQKEAALHSGSMGSLDRIGIGAAVIVEALR